MQVQRALLFSKDCASFSKCIRFYTTSKWHVLYRVNGKSAVTSAFNRAFASDFHLTRKAPLSLPCFPLKNPLDKETQKKASQTVPFREKTTILECAVQVMDQVEDFKLLVC